MDERFWVVWNPQRGLPRMTHPNEALARKEAERLARLQPGEQFYILQAVAVCQIPSIWRAL